MLTIEPPPASAIAEPNTCVAANVPRQVDLERARGSPSSGTSSIAWPQRAGVGRLVDAGVVDEHAGCAVRARRTRLERRAVGDVGDRVDVPPADLGQRSGRRRARRGRSTVAPAPASAVDPARARGCPSAPVTTATRAGELPSVRMPHRRPSDAASAAGACSRMLEGQRLVGDRPGGAARGRRAGRARTAAGRRPATWRRGPRVESTCPAGRSRAATSFLPILSTGAASLGYIVLLPSPSATRVAAAGRAPACAGPAARARRRGRCPASRG